MPRHTHTQLPPLDTVAGDALIGSDLAVFSPTSRSAVASGSKPYGVPRDEEEEDQEEEGEVHDQGEGEFRAGEGRPPPDESAPLLGAARRRRKKPFYRARPLWLVPFAITAALVRGMTVAPRVEIFTQLSCDRLHGRHDGWNHTQLPVPHTALSASFDPNPFIPNSNTTTPLITKSPPPNSNTRCLSDPAVQAGAARLQTLMTTTTGLLTALTTGWWGRFGERHGRTRVLAFTTLGLVLTDLAFLFISSPSSMSPATHSLSVTVPSTLIQLMTKHKHHLLLGAPVIEGFLGGWSALQSATSAYLSDCTSPGSRAPIFSRFQGVFYLGFAVGPSLGGWLIRHPVIAGGGLTSVFAMAVLCSLVNLMLVVFVFPESLGKKKMERAVAEAEAAAKSNGKGKARAQGVVRVERVPEESKGVIAGFLSPLAVFLPVVVVDPARHRKRRDWSLTMLAIALFGYMLSTGLYQIRYLYAVHTYGWGAEQLGYYISFMGGGRAVWLLFLLPAVIGWLKPRSETTKKAKPTRGQLGKEIKFDLALTRWSLFMDMVSHTLVASFPGPGETSYGTSQALFVMGSSLNGMGSGAVPAIHSLALCMTQARGTQKEEEKGNGELFGALAVLQAVGQMIIGPMLFGVVYSGTVGGYPKAVFVVGAGMMVLSLCTMLCIRNPVREWRRDVERGRSRVSKDLRGGAI